MARGIEHPALLSDSQLENFRSHLRVKKEAAFLAPQLFELVTVLTRDLELALRTIEGFEAAALKLTTALEQATAGDDCTIARDPSVQAAIRELKEAFRAGSLSG